jgi:hypothetical protein
MDRSTYKVIVLVNYLQTFYGEVGSMHNKGGA